MMVSCRYESDRQKLLREIEELEKRSEGEQKELHQSLLKKLKVCTQGQAGNIRYIFYWSDAKIVIIHMDVCVM